MLRFSSPARRAGAVLLAGLVAGAAGCGSDPRGDVQGRVTYRGKPVVWGTVVVIGADHMPYYATIRQDGTFTVKDVPVGPAKVGVTSPDPGIEPKMTTEQKQRHEELRRGAGLESPPKPMKGAWFPIPGRYNDPLKSELNCEVTAPNVTFDLALN